MSTNLPNFQFNPADFDKMLSNELFQEDKLLENSSYLQKLSEENAALEQKLLQQQQEYEAEQERLEYEQMERERYQLEQAQQIEEQNILRSGYNGNLFGSLVPKKYIRHDDNFNRIFTPKVQLPTTSTSNRSEDFQDPENTINYNTQGSNLFVLSSSTVYANVQAPSSRSITTTQSNQNNDNPEYFSLNTTQENSHETLSTPQKMARYSEIESLFSMPTNLTQHDIDILNISLLAKQYEKETSSPYNSDEELDLAVNKSIQKHLVRLTQPKPVIGFNSTSPKPSNMSPRIKIHSFSPSKQQITNKTALFHTKLPGNNGNLPSKSPQKNQNISPIHKINQNNSIISTNSIYNHNNNNVNDFKHYSSSAGNDEYRSINITATKPLTGTRPKSGECYYTLHCVHRCVSY